MIKICPVCNKEFKTTNPHQIRCSFNCYQIARENMFDAKVVKECAYCGKKFRSYECQHRKYCSAICMSKAKTFRVMLTNVDTKQVFILDSVDEAADFIHSTSVTIRNKIKDKAVFKNYMIEKL